MFSVLYYVKIYPDKIIARNVSSGLSAEEIPTRPYKHSRLLIGNVDFATLAIKSAIQRVKSTNPLKAQHLLIHPISEFPGGVAESEQRLFRMAAYEAHAAQVVLYFGPELSDEQARVQFEKGEPPPLTMEA